LNLLLRLLPLVNNRCQIRSQAVHNQLDGNNCNQ
jgi:hypothetical protein